MVNNLYNDLDYGLKNPKPKFLLSIIGGDSSHSKMDWETEKVLKTCLMKAAKISDSWIITSGTDDFVSQLVSDAVEEDSNYNNLTIMGICSQKKVYGSYPDLKLNGDTNPTNENKKLLHPIHSSFLFIQYKDEKDERKYRVNLENYIHKTLKIPLILVVIDGSFIELQVIFESLEKKIPIMIVVVRVLFSKY